MRTWTANTARLLVLAPLLATLGAGPALGDGRKEPPSPQDPAPIDPRVAEAAARDLRTRQPGREHQFLEPLVGSWKVEVAQYSPNREPIHKTGTSENTWILGGRFLRCEGEIGEGDAKVESTTIYGFDNRRRMFFALGLNTRATSYIQPWGSYDAVTHSFILSGKERDEATNSALVYRELLRIQSPDSHVLQLFYDRPGRPPLKVMEAIFTRR